MKQTKTLLAASMLVLSLFITACGGGSSSSGGGSNQLTMGPAPSPDNNFFYRVDASCGGGDVYRNGILKEDNLLPGGVTQDTYPPGNHQIVLMPPKEPFNPDKALDKRLLSGVSGNQDITFTC